MSPSHYARLLKDEAAGNEGRRQWLEQPVLHPLPEYHSMLQGAVETIDKLLAAIENLAGK